MNGFHEGYESKSISTFHTASGGASISTWARISHPIAGSPFGTRAFVLRNGLTESTV